MNDRLYSPASFRICKVQPNGYYSDILEEPNDVDNESFFGARSIYNNKNKEAVRLTPGTYVVRVKVNWVGGKQGKFTLSAYSSVPI